jgi:hypothetical protein
MEIYRGFDRRRLAERQIAPNIGTAQHPKAGPEALFLTQLPQAKG